MLCTRGIDHAWGRGGVAAIEILGGKVLACSDRSLVVCWVVSSDGLKFDWLLVFLRPLMKVNAPVTQLINFASFYGLCVAVFTILQVCSFKIAVSGFLV